MILIKSTSDKKIVGKSPAIIEEYIGKNKAIIYTNNDIFPKLTKFQQEFVIWHEKGHYFLDTDSEIQADSFAFNKLVGTQYESLDKSIGAIYEVLPVMNESRPERLKAMLERVLKWDYAHGNKNAFQELRKVKSMDIYDFLNYFENEYVSKIDTKKYAFDWDSFNPMNILTLGVYGVVSNSIKGAQERKLLAEQNKLVKELKEIESVDGAREDNTKLSLSQQKIIIIIVAIMAIAVIFIFD